MSDIRSAVELAGMVSDEVKASGHAEEIGRHVIDGAANAATTYATGSHVAGHVAGAYASRSVSSDTASSAGGFVTGLATGVALFVASPFILVGTLLHSAFSSDE